MEAGVQKILSLIMVIMVVFSSVAAMCVNAEESSAPAEDSTEVEIVDDGTMNLDVVFVLDGSGSMLSSDPNRVAVDAFNLFVDLCDESCAAGYTIFSEKIKATNNITSLEKKSDLEKIKNNLSSIQYDAYGDTDIALGLTKAMNMHKEYSKTADPNRKKAIILLSDGNTHLLNDKPRSADESQKEMVKTLAELKKLGIPVYSIGLNYDGTLDKNEVNRISKKTNGKAFETKSSDNLPGIISDIFSSIYQIGGKDLAILKGNVDIRIKDNSVFYVNVIIRSTLDFKALNPQLKKPDGTEVDLSNPGDNIKVTSTKSYTMLKLINPDPGKWRLYLENATADNCQVRQLDFYSVYVNQRIEKEGAISQPIKLIAQLSDGDGIVKDLDLLKTITMTAYVTAEDEEKPIEIELKRKTDYSYMGEFIPEKAGTYTIYTRAVSETFTKNSAKAKLKIKDEIYSGERSQVDMTMSEEDQDFFKHTLITILIVVAIVALIAAVIVAVIITALKKAKEKAAYELTKLQRAPDHRPEMQPHNTAPRPRPQPQPPARPQPAAKPPELVDYEVVEHDALENLIKKGADDSFNGKAEDYQTDVSLESLIKKGSDDPFHASADSYSVDPSLAALIKTGGDGLEGNKIKPEEETPSDGEGEE